MPVHNTGGQEVRIFFLVNEARLLMAQGPAQLPQAEGKLDSALEYGTVYVYTL